MMTIVLLMCCVRQALSPLSAEERRNPLLHYFHITPMRLVRMMIKIMRMQIMNIMMRMKIMRNEDGDYENDIMIHISKVSANALLEPLVALKK